MKLKAYDVMVGTMILGDKKIGVTAYDETMAGVYAVTIAKNSGFKPTHVISVTELV